MLTIYYAIHKFNFGRPVQIPKLEITKLHYNIVAIFGREQNIIMNTHSSWIYVAVQNILNIRILLNYHQIWYFF